MAGDEYSRAAERTRLASETSNAASRKMRPRFDRWFALVACAAALGATGSSQAADAPPRGCVSVDVESRYYELLGYSHLATARSTCSRPVECQLWTDVDPPQRRVELQPGGHAEVLFRRGSPASEFRAFARCQFLK